MPEPGNRNAFVATIPEPKHNRECEDANLIFNRPSRIVFGLDPRNTICEKTAEEITQLLKALADIELLIWY